MAIVGESGCGKSVSSLAIMRLLAKPAGRVARGSIRLEGRDLLALSDEEMREVRGRDISMIFQEPMTSLNPVLPIGLQIMEPLLIHLKMDEAAARARAVELLRMVGITDAERRLDQYPHQFSGGMRQRVMIAIGLACNPKLIIADEPTTALDVTIQAQILELMKDLSRELDIALIIITHNLGVVARYADRVNVMYAARIVEQGTADDIFLRPRHPYTLGLMRSVPRLDRPRGAQARDDRGAAAQPAGAACGLPLRAALPAPHRGLRAGSRTGGGRGTATAPRAGAPPRWPSVAAAPASVAQIEPAATARRRGAAARGPQSQQAFRRQGRRPEHARRRPRDGARGRGRLASTSGRARRWAWSANPAAARPRSAA